MYGAMCALTGLYHRNMTGQGQHIDLSQMVASVPLVGPALLDFTATDAARARPGFPPGNRAHWPGTPLAEQLSRARPWRRTTPIAPILAATTTGASSSATRTRNGGGWCR